MSYVLVTLLVPLSSASMARAFLACATLVI